MKSTPAVPPTLANWESALATLRSQGYITPGTSVSEIATRTISLQSHPYLYILPDDFWEISPFFGETETGLAYAFAHTLDATTLNTPFTLVWHGNGVEIATVLYHAGFCVRWDGKLLSCLLVAAQPFYEPFVPLWAPTPWEHLMDALRVLEVQGITAPTTATLSIDIPRLPTPHVTFGMLEQTIARYGTLEGSRPSTSPFSLATPLVLTWQGTIEEGEHIAMLLRESGCNVWWNGLPQSLMAVAPTSCNLTMLHTEFPLWKP